MTAELIKAEVRNRAKIHPIASLLILLLAFVYSISSIAINYEKEESRWAQSKIDYAFLKSVVNEKNCKSTFQKFAGCVLSLQYLANISLGYFEIKDSAAYNSEESTSGAESKTKTDENIKSKNSPIYFKKLKIFSADKEIAPGERVLINLGTIKVVEIDLNEFERASRAKDEAAMFLAEKRIPSDFFRQKNAEQRSEIEKIYKLTMNAQLNLISKLLEFIELKKIKPVDNMIAALTINIYLIHAVDPHSNLVLVKSYEESLAKRGQEFAGIGANLIRETESRGIIVKDVLAESAAQAAGLKPGDFILKVDSNEVSGFELEKTVKHIRGQPGTIVELTIQRGGVNSTIKIVRKKTFNPNNTSTTFEYKNKIFGYAKLGHFGKYDMKSGVSPDCEDLKKFFSNFQSKTDGAILDLRSNPGGDVLTAACIAGIFLGSEKVLAYFRFETKEYFSQDIINLFKLKKSLNDSKPVPRFTLGNQLFSKPLIVLVNEFSASASELLAAQLRDFNRALIVGNTTYGNGSSMGDKAYLDGSATGFLKLGPPSPEGQVMLLGTNGLFYSPSGQSHQGTGLEPQIKIFKDLVPSTSERVDRREGTINLFPLAKNEFIPPIDARLIEKMGKEIVVPVSCIRQAKLQEVYATYKQWEPLRDLQLLSGLEALNCQLSGKNR